MERQVSGRTASRQRRSTNLATLRICAIVPILFLFLQLFFLVLPAGIANAAPNIPKVAAPSAIAVDAGTGRILFAKDINRRTPMASTTKIMTAIVAVSISGVDQNEKYKAVKADLVGEASMGLREGDTVTFQDLLYGLLLNSGNDAAMGIARYAGGKLPGNGDPVTKFINQMNIKAVELGMYNSHYANPHGLDQEGHYSSAFDLAISGWYLLQDPLLANIVATPSATRAGKDLRNLNKFLGRYQGANGIKPGITDAAGLCLVTSATRSGKTVITVVLNEETEGYNNDPLILTDYAFAALNSPETQSEGAGSKAEFIGKVNGNKLITQNVGNPNTNPLQVISNSQSNNNGLVSAQVISGTVENRTGSNPSQQVSGSAGDDNNNSQNRDGGMNIFMILLLVALVLVVLWIAARFGLIAGDRGRDVAYSVQDGLLAGMRATGRGISKLFHNLKPGNSETPAELPIHNAPAPDYTSRVQTTRPSQTGRTSSQQPTGHTTTTGRGGITDYSFSEESRPSRPNISRGVSQTSSTKPTPASPNPLEGFFDDTPAFAIPEQVVRPPNPLQTRPAAPYSTRTAAEPQQKPEAKYSPPPKPQPVSAASAAPLGSEAVAARAQQAIDYAYAGRMQASTDEFRKVIEQNPLFDFGSIEEFEQMPVLGFKALANAYHSTGRTKFALLLLDMAVEKYPNDLELRNLSRTFKREAG